MQNKINLWKSVCNSTVKKLGALALAITSLAAVPIISTAQELNEEELACADAAIAYMTRNEYVKVTQRHLLERARQVLDEDGDDMEERLDELKNERRKLSVRLAVDAIAPLGKKLLSLIERVNLKGKHSGLSALNMIRMMDTTSAELVEAAAAVGHPNNAENIERFAAMCVDAGAEQESLCKMARYVYSNCNVAFEWF